MTKEELYHKLVRDMSTLKLPIDEVDLYLRPYSKTYYGRYFPSKKKDVKPKIYIYPFKNESSEEDFLIYDKILDTAIHEMVHHIQHSDPCFKRVKGIMHNTKFWEIYNHYINKADRLEIIDKEVLYEFKAIMEEYAQCN